ncbi:MAG: DUF4340 domain-containing protein [Chloroflexi bacterium]|nr:DUF4340 domain-containing protein [Chloroflexota bacterium]
MDRRNQILSAVLIIQIALVAFVFWPSQNSNAAVGKLLTGVKAADVTDVKIQDDKKTVHMAKTDGKWVLPDNGNYPVNEIQVNQIISKVLAVDTSRLVASTAASHKRLKVDDKDFMRRIDLTTSDGKAHTILVGTSPNVRATNVRAAGSDPVYLSGDVTGADISTEMASWIDATYFTANQPDIKAIAFANAKGKFDFTHTISNTWTLVGLAKGEQFNQDNFSTRLTRVGSLQMLEPLGKEAKPEYGLDKPSATLTVTVQPTTTVPATVTTFVIGAKDATSNSYVVKSSRSDYYVRIASFTLDSFVEDDRSQFLVAPPTPTVAPATTPATKP